MPQALLIIDVQNAILAGKATPDRQPMIDGALDATVERLKALKDRASAAGIPVILVQHDGPAGHRLAVGTPGWDIRPEIAPAPGDVVVHKQACDSFFETDLKERLDGLGIDKLVIGGCMSQFCVDTTTRRAVSLGYDVVLVADGHMTGDAGALTYDEIVAHHNATLDGFDAGERVVSVRPSAEITF